MTITPSPPSQSSDLSIKAAASLTPCCVRTLRKAIAGGHLHAYRLGHRIFIKPEHFEAYLQKREVPVVPDEIVPKASDPHDQPNHCHQNNLSDADQADHADQGVIQ